MSLLMLRRVPVVNPFLCTASTRRMLATTTSAQLISRTLYRQFLRWCQSIPPLTDAAFGSLLQQVIIEAPLQVDAYRTELLHQGVHESNNDDADATVVRRVRALLPSSTLYQADTLVVPIQSIRDARNVMRAVFRLNSYDTQEEEPSELRNEEINKMRRAEAFSKLKYLNELRDTQLTALHQGHVKNQDRTHVLFRVGQVVQHREERWRGVIVDWTKQEEQTEEEEDPSKSRVSSSSLTGKRYASSSSHPCTRYSMVVDEGDAYSLLMGRTEVGALEHELDAVTDPYLSRIRHGSFDFVRYDNDAASFVPNAIKHYEYPADTSIVTSSPDVAPETKVLCEHIIQGVKEVAGGLVDILLENAKHFHPRSQPSTTAVWRTLKRIEEGKHHHTTTTTTVQHTQSPLRNASLHVHALTEATRDILESMNQRRVAMEDCQQNSTIQFKVGDIVWHKKFNFRGVIVAWDAKPSIDVSNWDGLHDVENPSEMPFYQVVPDQRDCVESFGGKRGMRYVCEVNLELCRQEQLGELQIELDPEWKRDEDLPYFEPPVKTRFSYGEDVGDNGVLEKNMIQLEDEINRWQLRARDDNDNEKLSIPNLTKLLGLVDTHLDATIIQDALKDLRKANPDLEVRQQLDRGLSALIAGQSREARGIFEEVVKLDPTYAEAWSRLGIFQLLEGRIDDAENSLEKSIELDPTHFSALNSLGLLYCQRKDFEKAVHHFRSIIDLDPWSPVASRLSACVDIVARKKNESAPSEESQEGADKV